MQKILLQLFYVYFIESVLSHDFKVILLLCAIYPDVCWHLCKSREFCSSLSHKLFSLLYGIYVRRSFIVRICTVE